MMRGSRQKDHIWAKYWWLRFIRTAAWWPWSHGESESSRSQTEDARILLLYYCRWVTVRGIFFEASHDSCEQRQTESLSDPVENYCTEVALLKAKKLEDKGIQAAPCTKKVPQINCGDCGPRQWRVCGQVFSTHLIPIPTVMTLLFGAVLEIWAIAFISFSFLFGPTSKLIVYKTKY